MDTDTLFTTFNLPGCTNVEWITGSPTYLVEDEDGHIDWRVPPIPICTFHFEYYDVGYYGHFYDDPSLAPAVYAPHYRDVESPDFITVARAIGQLRAFQHAEWILRLPLDDAVKTLNISAIAAYQASPNLRRSFPRLEQSINRTTENGGFIYLLTDQQGHYKIGHTKTLDKRIYQLGTQPPFEIKLLKSCWVPHRQDVEKWLHKICEQYRMRGEWFKFDDQELGRAMRWFDSVKTGNEETQRVIVETDWAKWRDFEHRTLSPLFPLDYADERDVMDIEPTTDAIQ